MATLVYNQADSPKKLDEALQLLARVYTRAGYIENEQLPQGHREAVHRPVTATFVAYIDDVLVGTVSVFGDSRLGIPMDNDAHFHEDLAPFRAKGTIAEIGKLAVDKDVLRDKTAIGDATVPESKIVSELFRLVTLYGIHQHIGHYVIAVEPKHASFYNRALRFKPIGPLREYASCAGALPSMEIPMAIDMGDLIRARDSGEKIGMLYESWLRKKPPEEGQYVRRAANA